MPTQPLTARFFQPQDRWRAYLDTTTEVFMTDGVVVAANLLAAFATADGVRLAPKAFGATIRWQRTNSCRRVRVSLTVDDDGVFSRNWEVGTVDLCQLGQNMTVPN
ncbi:MAG: hypothetical protein ABSA97_14910 [Verrucomicrobiia bacterium]